MTFYENYTNTGTLNNSGTLTLTDDGTLTNHNISSTTTIANLTINKSGNGTVYIQDNPTTITSLTISSSNQVIEVPASKSLVLTNGVTIPGGTFKIKSGAELQIGNGASITLTGGTFQTTGISDSFPQNAANKAVIDVVGGTGTWSFTTTGGTLSLTGFHFDHMAASGLSIGGNTVVSALNGGQFTNLSSSYASVTAIQINTTGSIPASATNIGWSWGDFNSFDPANVNTPTSSDGYTLVSSTGCGSQSIDFTGWSGDWYESQDTFDVSTKVSASSCTISLGAYASAVALTSFEALGYNNAIDIRWETSVESEHLGFNVLRANEDATEFQQINSELIRNLHTAGDRRGRYRFIDHDVNNGEKYYYYIEDVEIGGEAILHGPVSATPITSAGSPPADEVDENSGSYGNDGDDGGTTSPGTIPNPSYKDLGNGVKVLSQTSKSLRLEVTSVVPTFTVSGWNGSYEQMALAGYSRTTTPDYPELLERDLLVEVHPFATTAVVSRVSVTDATVGGHAIAPAPDYAVDGNGDLQPSWNPDATVYATNSASPSTHYDLQGDLISIGGKTYLKIKIRPVKFNPVTGDVTYITNLTLDIGLDGSTWEMVDPSGEDSPNPFNVANTLRIDYTSKGMYQLDYDDLVDSEVNGPFDGVDVTDLRLYVRGDEVPIEFYSASGFFASGDHIRFYAPYERSVDDDHNRVILSTVDIKNSGTSPLRMDSIDADPSVPADAGGTVSSRISTWAESDDIIVDGTAIGDGDDHFFWTRIVNGQTHSFDVNLPELNRSSRENVEVRIHVFGEILQLNTVEHHLGVTVNGSTLAGETRFWDNSRHVEVVDIPASYFVDGINNIDIEATGLYVPGGQFERIYIDRVEFVYTGTNSGAGGLASFEVDDFNSVIDVDGFTNSTVHVYDISDQSQTSKLANVAITGAGPWQASFYVPDDEVVSVDGYKLYELVQGGALKAPARLSLSPGYYQSLKSSSRRADLLIIGHETLLMAARHLVSRREGEGFVVAQVTPDQIYGEFADGRGSSQAIQDFVNYSLNNWARKPQYLLILGDGTDDPRNRNVYGEFDEDLATLDPETLPMPFFGGRFLDFGSDHFFAINGSSNLPRIAVGRLPTNDPQKIDDYVQKVIDYEDGDASPTNLRQISFVVDGDSDMEKFREQTDQITPIPNSYDNGFTTNVLDEAELGDAAMNGVINSEFEAGSFMISMLGHGGWDGWGWDYNFDISDAAALGNSEYPIVLTWNCESALYYFAANYELSLGEELVLNSSGGAIAFLGSTAQTTPPAQMKLASALFSKLASKTDSPDTSDYRLGDLFKESKIATGTGTYERDIVNSFTLIGDPMLKIPSDLFPDPPPRPVPVEVPVEISGGGCSLFAGDGRSNVPWWAGMLEWLAMIFMIVGGNRLLGRRKRRSLEE